MPKGKIKNWNAERGFGFITPDDGSKDIFAHCRELVDQSHDHLPIGTPVQFEIQRDERDGKRRATKIAELNGSKEVSPRPSPRAAAEAVFRN